MHFYKFLVETSIQDHVYYSVEANDEVDAKNILFKHFDARIDEVDQMFKGKSDHGIMVWNETQYVSMMKSNTYCQGIDNNVISQPKIA